MNARPLVSLLLVFAACSDVRSREAHVDSEVASGQAVRAPQVVRPRMVSCTDGTTRTIGGPDALQVVVIASPLDCTLKREHLRYVGEALSTLGDRKLAFIVSAVPIEEHAAVERLFDQTLQLPLCWDRGGASKVELNIVAGPTTVIVRNGRIVWRVDGGDLLSSTMLREALEREVASFRRN
jgi:hypothetical protein